MVTIEANENNGLSKKSSIDLFQVRSLSEKRLAHKVGVVEDEILEACKSALNVVFD
jgi:mRNA interferase MazF